MGSTKLNTFGCGRGKRGYRVPFDITPPEIDSECNENFRKELRGGIKGIDGDYKMFLEYLTGEQRETVGGCAENNEVEVEKVEREEEVDPHYKMFMDKLTQYGKSYALNVHEGSGMLVLIKYHGVDDSDEYWDAPVGRKLSKGRNDGEEMRGAKVLRNLGSKEDVGNWSEERKRSLLEKVLKRELVNTESCDTEGCRKRRRADWENRHMAEPHEEPHEMLNSSSCRESWKSAEGVVRSTGEKEQSNSVPKKELGYAIGTNHRSISERNMKHADRQNLRSNLEKGKSSLLAKKKLGPKTICHDSHGAKTSQRQRFVVENDDMSKPQRNCETDDIEIDGCYQVFLNGIENEGGCMVFVHGGERVKYEDDCIDNDTDSEILMWDHDQFLSQNNNNPFVTTKVKVPNDGEDNEKEVSRFRRKLMRILKRPYNTKEYNALYREIKVRKPMEVHREMRRPKSVSVDRLGKSYLDHHPDLKKKIDAVRGDYPKVLNILRGFFFWLKNTCHEGEVFKPWKDASCLAVVPPSK